MNIIKKILNNKKGLNTIETAIISIIIIMCIAGMIDLNTIIKKFNTTSSTTSYIARTIGKQGGIRTSKPDNFHGDYVTSQKLYQDVKSILNKAGIKDSEFSVTINGYPLHSGTNIPLTTYGTNMTIKLTIQYRWKLVQQFIKSSSFEKTSNRIVMSTYKERESGSLDSDFN